MTKLFYRLDAKNQAHVLDYDEGYDIPANQFYEFLDTIDISSSAIEIIVGDCERTIVSLESAQLLGLETDGARVQEAWSDGWDFENSDEEV